MNELLQLIITLITTNGQGLIDAEKMRTVLNAIVNASLLKSDPDSTLSAQNITYVNGQTENVKEALDALIEISADLKKTDIGYNDTNGSLTLRNGAKLYIDGSDILSYLTASTSWAGDYDASTNTLPTIGTGTGNPKAIRNDDRWRVTVPNTIAIAGLQPHNILQIGDLIFAKQANATLASHFYVQRLPIDVTGKIDISSIVNNFTDGGAQKVASAETVKLLKQALDLLTIAVGAKLNISDIVDNFTTVSTTKAASANRAKILYDLYYSLNDYIHYVDSKKVETVAGQSLMTAAERSKLAALNEHYKGTHLTLAALQAAYPTAAPGNYATIDAGNAETAKQAIWDVQSGWVVGAAGSGAVNSVNGQIGTVVIPIPTNTSELTNDSNFVADINYIHTDNNYSNEDNTKLSAITGTNTGDQDLSGLAPKNNPTFTGTVTGVTKAMVGLGNVDNTSDVNKPVSAAQQTVFTDLANTKSSKGFAIAMAIALS